MKNQYFCFRKFMISEQYFLIVQTRSVMLLVSGNVFLEMFMWPLIIPGDLTIQNSVIFVILDIVMFSLPRQLYPTQLTKCWSFSFHHYFSFCVERSSEPAAGQTEHIILEPAHWIWVSSQIWTFYNLWHRESSVLSSLVIVRFLVIL